MRSPRSCCQNFSEAAHPPIASLLFLFYPLGIHNLYNTYGQCEGFHGTALVIEDAETLRALLSRVESRTQVSRLIMAYEDIRCRMFITLHLFHCP